MTNLIKRIEIPVFIMSIIALLGFVLYNYALVQMQYIDRIVNSDALYLASLYQDIFTDNIGLSGWQLNGAPNFFPDMPLYFIIHFITGNVITTALVYGFVQNIIIITLIYFLCKQLLASFNLYIPAFINLLFILALMTGAFSPNNWFMHHLFINAYHTSSFINSLICFILLIKYLKNNKLSTLILLIVFIILSSLSDKVFIIGFVLPAITVTFYLFIIEKNNRKKPIILFLTLLFSTIVSHLIFRGLILYSPFGFIHKDLNLSSGKITTSINTIIQLIIALIKENDVSSINVEIGFIALFISIFLFFKNFKFKTEKSKYLQIFNLFFITFFIFVLLAPVLTGQFKFYHQIRYNIFVFYFGFISFGILISQYIFVKNFKYGVILLSTVAVIFVGVLLMKKGFNIEKKLKYVPEYITDIETISQKTELKKGISGYWQARHARFLSNQKVQLYAIYYPTISPFNAGTYNKYWFYQRNEFSQSPVFNYILLKETEDLNFFIEKFGKSKAQIIKQGKTTIIKVPDFIFDKKTKQFKYLHKK